MTVVRDENGEQEYPVADIAVEIAGANFYVDFESESGPSAEYIGCDDDIGGGGVESVNEEANVDSEDVNVGMSVAEASNLVEDGATGVERPAGNRDGPHKENGLRNKEYVGDEPSGHFLVLPEAEGQQ